MSVSSGKCDNCGADLTSEPVASTLGGFDVICVFCGHHHHVPGEKKRDRDAEISQPDPDPRPESPPVSPPAAKPAPAPTKKNAIRGWLLVAAILGGTVLMVYVIHLLAEGSVYYDDVGGPPVLATVNGREIAIGRTRDIGGSDQLYINAFDATTVKQLWQAGPYGTYIQGYQATHWDVAGSHVAVTDFHSKVHILDLATGAEQYVLTLSDKADRVCPLDANHVVVRQIDKRALSLDFTAQKLTDITLPVSCGGVVPDTKTLNPLDSAEHEIPNFTPWFDFPHATFEAKSMNVVYGIKSPGTEIPTAVGLDPNDLSVKWRVLLPMTDPDTVRGVAGNATVFGDRFVAAYGLGDKDWHVTALDATSGARQWDVVLKPGRGADVLGGIMSSATRVYVVRENAVDVLDAATGHVVGTLGSE